MGQINSKKVNVLDIFSGAGGMSYGFQNAGYNIAYAIDSDKDAIATFKYNHKETCTLCNKVEDIDFSNFKNINVIIGGFPCTPFTKTRRNGKKGVQHKDEDLYQYFLKAIKEIKPEIFVMENVPSLKHANNNNNIIYNNIYEYVTNLGYYINDWNINMAFWGVPQKRERLILIGSRIGKVDINCYSHKNNLGLVSVNEAIGDLEKNSILVNGDIKRELKYIGAPLTDYQCKRRNGSLFLLNHFGTKHSPEVKNRFKYISPGGNWKDIPYKFLPSTKIKQSNVYKRLEKDNQSVTITHIRKTLLLHPTLNRTLSAREAARLQGFNDSYIFIGGKNSIFQQIGNAVPPIVSENIAKDLLRYLL